MPTLSHAAATIAAFALVAMSPLSAQAAPTPTPTPGASTSRVAEPSSAPGAEGTMVPGATPSSGVDAPSPSDVDAPSPSDVDAPSPSATGSADLESGGSTTVTPDATPESVSPTPTVERREQHPIAQRWRVLGGERGWLGKPTMGIACGIRGGGCFQSFEHGGIYWSQATGAKFVRGEIRQGWGRLGWETGRLGYPTSDEDCGIRGGCFQRFQGGIMYWSPSTGAHATWGAIGAGYGRLGWETGKLGFPRSREFCGLPNGGCVQRFQGGHVYWTPSTGAHATWGRVDGRFGRLGWERSFLGYPTGPEFCGLRDGGCGQRFQGGMMYWSPGSGAHPMRGKLLDAYGRQGYERGPLRYPTSGEYRVGGNVQQNYQGGQRHFDFGTGKVSDPNAQPRHVEHCEASNYWQGQMTASGERFDLSAMTAAHKTLPFNTKVRVTNKANGKSVVVRINDRGPYIGGRCIDLSRGSFSHIASPSAGVAQVKVEVL